MKNKSKIAFQGALGAYSHLACLEMFPNTEVKACSSFEEAFKLAKENSDYKIIIPIENSLAGRVADIHYLLPKYLRLLHCLCNTYHVTGFHRHQISILNHFL